jgi:DNA-binding XRE family transcriptional regulator
VTYPMTTPTAVEIREARVAARLTRSAMASLIGISEQTLKNWETGKARPNPGSVGRYYEALDRIANPRMNGDGDEWHRWRAVRERAGFTQAQMALFMDVDEEDIVEWERPKRYPTVAQRARYAALLARLDEDQAGE